MWQLSGIGAGNLRGDGGTARSKTLTPGWAEPEPGGVPQLQTGDSVFRSVKVSIPFFA
jgi:hypothetical protein